MRNIILLLNLFLSFEAIATLYCPNIRLDKSFEGEWHGKEKKNNWYDTMKTVPVQDQSLGICYAYAACQMADAARNYQSFRDKKAVDKEVCSPLFVAAANSENWDDDAKLKKNGNVKMPFEGGSLCNAYKQIQKNNVCTRSQLDDYLLKQNISEQDFFNKIHDIEAKIKQKKHEVISENKLKYTALTISTFFQLDDVTLTTLDLDYGQCKANAFDEYYKMLKQVFGDLLPVKEAAMKYFSVDMLNSPADISSLFKFICPYSKRLKHPKNFNCEDKYHGDLTKKQGSSFPMVKEIIEGLKSRSMPVGISYCSRMFSRTRGGKNFDGIKSRSGNSTDFYPTDSEQACGNHASLIMGSRFNKTTKKCELLIRNTWGKGCSNYHSDFDCEGGNIWVDHDVLEKNTYRIQRMEP